MNVNLVFRHPLRYLLQGSIGRKYGAGYILILFLMLLVFLVSFGGSAWVSRMQNEAIDDLLNLNELFVDLETVDRYVYDYYIFLRSTSLEGYEKSAKTTYSTVNKVQSSLSEKYSREVMDLTCMVTTYLEESTALVTQLSSFHGGDASKNAGLQKQYDKLRRTTGFINHSFKTIYSTKLISTEELQKNLFTVTTALEVIQIVIMGTAMLLFGIFYRRIIGELTASVNKLTVFATDVSHNPAGQEHVHLDTGDELSVFADTFNEMLDTINLQISQIEEDSRVRQQLQQAEMENMRISSSLQQSQLRLLQARINPHFLFNTLNMISQTAYIENAEQTASLIETTAKLLRYNLGKMTTPVTLRAELENTECYITIQKQRFGSRINITVESDGKCEMQEVPCLILQPLVENSITHGIGDRIVGGNITVRLFRSDDRAWLEVEDDGAGITAEELAKLRQMGVADEPADEHIGLRNVYQRLMLYFCEDVVFTIESKPGHTVIAMGFPWVEN